MRMSDVRKSLRSREKKWYVYLLECSDGSYYCGITTDLSRRVSEHNNGSGAKYTKGRGPVRLIASKEVENRSSALKLEVSVKKKKKSDKAKFLLDQQSS